MRRRTDTQTHRRSWPLYISPTSATPHAKCNKTCKTQLKLLQTSAGYVQDVCMGNTHNTHRHIVFQLTVVSAFSTSAPWISVWIMNKCWQISSYSSYTRKLRIATNLILHGQIGDDVKCTNITRPDNNTIKVWWQRFQRIETNHSWSKQQTNDENRPGSKKVIAKLLLARLFWLTVFSERERIYAIARPSVVCL